MVNQNIALIFLPCAESVGNFAEWADESVSKAEILRLIYQGRFLHGNVTLGALGLPAGKTCVMHLVPRENLPEPNSQGESCDSFWVLCSLFDLTLSHNSS